MCDLKPKCVALRVFSWMAIVVALAVTIVPAPAAGAGSSCADVVSLAPGERFAGWPGRPGESFCYRVDVESPGALLVGAAVPALADAEPKLRLRERAGRVVVAERGVAHLALWVGAAGAYVFEVAAQDPRAALGEHSFGSLFVAESDAFTAATDDLPPKDGADGEIDPILNPVTSPSDPEPKDGGDGEIDPILNPVTVLPDGAGPVVRARRGGVLLFDRRAVLVHAGESVRVPGPTALRFYDLCRQDAAADADAHFACAVPLSFGEAAGEIAGETHDDHDVLTFVLAAQRTVRLETRGDVTTVGALYDRRGQRLALAGDGEELGSRLVRTLAAGRYFVRVEGRHGAAGTYTLSVAALSW